MSLSLCLYSSLVFSYPSIFFQHFFLRIIACFLCRFFPRVPRTCSGIQGPQGLRRNQGLNLAPSSSFLAPKKPSLLQVPSGTQELGRLQCQMLLTCQTQSLQLHGTFFYLLQYISKAQTHKQTKMQHCGVFSSSCPDLHISFAGVHYHPCLTTENN